MIIYNKILFNFNKSSKNKFVNYNKQTTLKTNKFQQLKTIKQFRINSIINKIWYWCKISSSKIILLITVMVYNHCKIKNKIIKSKYYCQIHSNFKNFNKY